MSLPLWVEKTAQAAVDAIYTLAPQKLPSAEMLQACKIVSHRGEHDNLTVLENTLPAFDAVFHKNVWGIELDIRWTKDLQPVVIHDPDCRRVFGSHEVVCEVSLKDLQSQVPLIPTLEEVIGRYGKKMHLMVELKQEPYPQPAHQRQRLQELFAGLVPQEDFHFISLTPAMFQHVDFVENSALLPVAELNFQELSHLALEQNYGGVTGHYFLLNNSFVEKHAAAHQKIGTGFVRSKNCLMREVNRGVEWVFSNHALKLQALCEELLAHQ